MSFFIALLRVVFGLLFMVAGIGKILYPGDFAQIIYNYQMVPDLLVHPMAIILPWVEFVCGAALATNCFKRGAASILSVLLLIFLAALWYNISRGLDVNCGCFTVDPNAKSNLMEAAVRDTVLFAAGLIVLWRAFADATARKNSAKLWRQIKGLPDPEEKRRKAREAKEARKMARKKAKDAKDLLNYAPPEPTIQGDTLLVGMAAQAGQQDPAEAAIPMPGVPETEDAAVAVEPGEEAAEAKDR